MTTLLAAVRERLAGRTSAATDPRVTVEDRIPAVEVCHPDTGDLVGLAHRPQGVAAFDGVTMPDWERALAGVRADECRTGLQSDGVEKVYVAADGGTEPRYAEEPTMTNSDWSVPESAVLHSVRDVLDGDGQGVLATIVDVEGSAYRRPGAKMVIPEGKAGVGHITAGCLEDEVQAIAAEVLADGEPRVETYDLRPEAEDDVWGLGVGCNGVIQVLLEPIDEPYRTVVDAFDDDRDVGVVTVVAAEDDTEATVGARAYYDALDGVLSPGEELPAALTDRLSDAVADLAAQGRSNSFEVDGVTVFVDGIAAPPDLAVVGTGHDIGPITELATQAGFRVTVIGFRGMTATETRFPAAADVRSTSPARLREADEFDANTHVVVATHNYVDDRIAVDELLRTDVPYVGLMGPHERFREMLDDFGEEGREFSEAELDRLYTPVGLDLGGGTPHQIALSIVSEALAVSNGRDPGHLREREGAIHDRVELEADGGDVE